MFPNQKSLLALFFMFTSLVLAAQEHVAVASVNSEFDEQSPRLTPDGKQLYFTRSAHPDNYGKTLDRGDIWYSDLNSDGSWSAPRNAGRVLNHPGLNGVAGFSADGNTIYLLNYFEEGGFAGGTVKNGISKSSRVNGEWTKPEKLDITFFANNSEYISAYITPDEKTLLLSIKSYDTYGNEDIYVSFKQGDRWIQPINLGESINTFSEEWTPFLSADKSTLYFSSNGHGGEGSRDIFAAKRLDESWKSWTKPQNLGTTINTKGVELGYSIPFTGDMAYFTTTQNSEGFGDIFMHPLSETEKAVQAIELVKEPEQTTTVVTDEPEVATKPQERQTTPVSEKVMTIMTFQVLDKNTKKPVDAQVSLSFGDETTRMNTSEIESEDKKWVMSFEEGTGVSVDIQAEGYLNYHEEFVAGGKSVVSEVQTGERIAEGFLLTPNAVGTKIEIEKILFGQGAASFADTVQAQANLDKLVDLMQSNPAIAIRLEGHTDSRGNPKLLKELSQSRVDTVKEYLVNRGVAASRIESVGYGGEKPIVRNISEANRQQNRRVEVVVIKN